MSLEKEKTNNPLAMWSKEEIKSALKAHSKKDLLIIAMQWRLKAEELKYVYNELIKDNS
tara:strand:- start:173 stop:349 length:177 start_codon:yes stop_codon:yes gene_type:complete